MRFTYFALFPFVLGTPTFLSKRAAVEPVYWLLAGDSTTAPNGGWGDAFLANTVAKGSTGHNYGHPGATTKSFRDGGDWGRVINDVGTYKGKYRVYVTVQFGHNDQKPTSGVTLADYKTNLGNFATEVVAAGGVPILVTPLTRRVYNETTHRVIESLAAQRNITIAVAKEKKVHWIDLNRASENYCNAIGENATKPYDLYGTDTTHLSPWGAVVFSRIVSDLLVEKYPAEFDAVTVNNATMTKLIEEGKPV